MSAFAQVAEIPLSLRRAYLAALPEPQEWFLEELVRSGDVWVAPGAAYAIFHNDRLVEFHAVNSADAHRHLSRLRYQRPFETALAKSFDRALVSAAKTLGWTVTETGFLFRKRTPTDLARPDGFRLVQAQSADLAEVWATGRDFYDSADEVAQLYRSNGLWVAFDNGHIVGSGVMIPIDGTGRVVDIGMVTRPDQRNKGVASRIVCELANMLERAGKRPICGCGPSNLASKAALEKAGFVCEHRLVQINVRG